MSPATCAPPLATGAGIRALVYAGCVIVALLVLLGTVILVLRRRYVDKPTAASKPGSGFGLDDVERLRDEGQLDEAEFRRLRRRVLGLEAASDSALSADGDDDDVEPAAGRDDSDGGDRPRHEESQ
ncbi:MAG: hypothetical protein KGY99_07415 [Phycisphaerae bacterium]|nr:hypothetical protein [Phycisphaerae bacterium]